MKLYKNAIIGRWLNAFNRDRHAIYKKYIPNLHENIELFYGEEKCNFPPYVVNIFDRMFCGQWPSDCVQIIFCLSIWFFFSHFILLLLSLCDY